MENVVIKIEQVITQQRIEDLLCGAFEGGSDYWAITGVTKEQKDAVKAEYSFEVATRGGEIEVFDVEDTKTKLGVINEERIRKAFELMAKGENEKGESEPHLTEHLQQFLDECEDAVTGDVFLQLAVMGEVVFG